MEVSMRVFVAGAGGAIGKYLVPRLVARGHDVIGTTRDPNKIPILESLGATGLVMDGLDAGSVGEAVAQAQPDAIVHQMTSISASPDLRHFDRWFAATNALRTKGTENLLSAAQAAGVSRFVAQSFTGWTNERTGAWVKSEDDAFDTDPLEEQRESLDAIRFLERAVLDAPLEGIVLRYTNFYGPGASEELFDLVRKRRFPVVGDGRGMWSWIHIDDAAAATVAAIEQGRKGIYNVADDDPAPANEWLPYLAQVVEAKPPLRVPTWLARVVAGRVPVRWMTQGRGVSNDKAKRELGWTPRWATWRDGFRFALTELPDESKARNVA
jgi:nucleoside-diphosphate-sugar epimerase